MQASKCSCCCFKSFVLSILNFCVTPLKVFRMEIKTEKKNRLVNCKNLILYERICKCVTLALSDCLPPALT